MNSGGILTVEDRATQEGAKIYISDTGCGMPKDEISKTRPQVIKPPQQEEHS